MTLQSSKIMETRVKKRNWSYPFIILFLFTEQTGAFSSPDVPLPNIPTSNSEVIKPPPTDDHTKPQYFSPPSSFANPKIVDTKKQKKLKTSSSSGLVKSKSSLVLFQWLNEPQFSSELAYIFLKQPKQYAPSLLAEKINQDFLKTTLFLNFHQNIMQFPYMLKWGIRASTGLTRNEDNESIYFFPLSLSIILSLQIFKDQFITPFFEIGYSAWNIDFSELSEAFPFWSVGTIISLSLFKHSLRYTLPEEYGIQDMGIILEVRNNTSPFDFPDKTRGYFLHSLHAGIYLKF